MVGSFTPIRPEGEASMKRLMQKVWAHMRLPNYGAEEWITDLDCYDIQ